MKGKWQIISIAATIVSLIATAIGGVAADAKQAQAIDEAVDKAVKEKLGK